ncbi:MAG: vitamin K epoxide reductase family protein, partial [Spirochaetota bacterium]
MRKTFFLIAFLSGAGAVVAGLLVWIHFSGQTGNLPVWVPCGSPDSSCGELAKSSWSAVAGIPIASLGLFYYVWLCGVAVVIAFSGYVSAVLVLLFFAVVLFGLGV